MLSELPFNQRMAAPIFAIVPPGRVVHDRAMDDAGESLDSLMEAIARRDREAFRRLFQLMAPKIKAYLVRSGGASGAAEEVTQEVLLTVWRKAELYDRTKATAGAWVFAIARNKRIDFYRREKRPELDPNDPALTPDPPRDPDVQIDLAQSSSRLRQAMQDLPDDQSQLIQLSYFTDKSHSAIAKELGLPLGTVKSRIRLALAKLRSVLQEFV